MDELLYFLQTVNILKKKKILVHLTVPFCPVLLLFFVLFAIYLHVFSYSFRVMDQSQTNRQRSEVISWTAFLAHLSFKMQVLYLLVLTLTVPLSLSHICDRNVTADLWSPPSCRRAGMGTLSLVCRCCTAPAFLFLCLPFTWFATCVSKVSK